MKKAIIIGLNYYKKTMIDYYMEELKNLSETLNIEVVESIIQDSKQSSTEFKIGTGKVEEVKAMILSLDVDLVIFNDELTNSQIRNLEEALEVTVIDRTLLILDIFAKRAKTKEAQLQVEIAQLKYLLPRLTALRSSFDRQQGGIGSKGPGEKKLELDRRHIENEINQLKKELNQLVKVRKTNRLQRQKSMLKNVAIVGYTNAGKSTLMNTIIKASDNLSEKDVFTKDQLFATLETSTRKINLPDSKPFTLTDTIGFVSNLPHDLVESFKATLEEIQEADLLLHVIDFSHPYYFDQILTTNKVLKELGAEEIETIYVFNKIDLNTSDLPHGFTPSVKVSLKDETNIDELLSIIKKELFKHDVTVVYMIPHTRGDIVNQLVEHAEIIEREYLNEGVSIKASVPKVLKAQLTEFET